jgi:branched-subunit amino acid transport protein AzlD
MNDSQQVILIIAIAAVITLLLRVLPFLIFKSEKMPPFMEYLGKYLPYAIMGMLVVYCLRGTSFAAMPYGVPEIISVLVVAALYIWRKNTILSIVVGTICYMLLIRII